MRALPFAVLLFSLSGGAVTLARADTVSPAGLDTAWGVSGTKVLPFVEGLTTKAVTPVDAVVAADGSLFTIGTVEPGSPYDGESTKTVITKLTPDGALDTTFGTGGIATISKYGYNLVATTIALQPDGKILLAGTWDYGLVVMRLTASGVLDTTLNNYASVYNSSGMGFVKAMAMQPDGRIVVLGGGAAGNSTRLVRLTLAGDLDTTFGSVGVVSLNAHDYDTGRQPVSLEILVGGTFRVCTYYTSADSYNSVLCNPSQVRLNSNGSLDTTFGSRGEITSRGMYSDAIQTMVFDASGGATVLDGPGYLIRMERLTADGGLDPAFFQNGYLEFTHLGSVTGPRLGLVQRADGRMFLGGGQSQGFGLSRLRPDGMPDTDFNADGVIITNLGTGAQVTGLRARPDGTLIVFGSAPAPADASKTALAWAAYNPGPLEVDSPPVITTAPGSQTVHRGLVTTFTVAAAPNTLTPWYRWSKNGTVITTTYANFGPTLTIPSTEATDEGAYSVEVGNFAGSVVADGFSLTVIAPPAILAPPAGYSGPRGITYHFTVTVAGRTPLTYQWQKNDVDFGPSVITSALTSDLPVLADVSNVGDYRVIITNSEGTVTSVPATLTSGPSPPTIVNDLAAYDVVADPGGAADLSLEVTGVAPMTFQWQKNGKNYESPMVQASGHCDFSLPASSASNGTYRCVVTNADGTLTTRTVSLTVWPNPTVRMDGSRLLVQEGGELWIPVGIYTQGALDVLTYQWQLNGRTITGATLTDYLLENVTFADAGSYRVIVKGLPGTSVSNNASVAMVEKGQHPIIAAAGKTASLTVKTTGDGLSFLWHRSDGTPLPAGCTGVNTATLKIPNANTQLHAALHAALYACDVGRSGIPDKVTADGLQLVVESVTPSLQTTSLPGGAVGVAYQASLVADHSPTKFTVTGLPAGLVCDATTGSISGIPRASGPFTVKVTVANPVGAAATVSLSLTISALDPGAAGVFMGPLRAGYPSQEPFGSFGLTLTAAGTYTGKICYTNDSGHLYTASFTGQWGNEPDPAINAALSSTSSLIVLQAVAPGSGTTDNHVILDWDPTNGISGRLEDVDAINAYALTFYQNSWDARTRPATPFAGYYTADISPYLNGSFPNADASGSGFASFTPAPGGALTFAVTLADGTALAIPTFATVDGKAWVMAWPYGYHGLLAGEITLSLGSAPLYRDSGATGALHWRRPASTTVPSEPVDNTYFNGQTIDVAVGGARYLPPRTPFLGVTTSPLMMNSTAPFIGVALSGGDLTENYGFNTTGTLNTHNTAIFSYHAGDQVRISSMVFNPSTGGYSGTCIEYPDASGDRPGTLSGTFQGIVTRGDPTSSQAYGAGHFTRTFTHSIYNLDDPAHPRLVQRFPLVLSGDFHILPSF